MKPHGFFYDFLQFTPTAPNYAVLATFLIWLLAQQSGARKLVQGAIVTVGAIVAIALYLLR